MSATTTSRLPPQFTRLAWANLTAQAAEQLSLTAAPIIAVLSLGAGAGQTGLLQTVQTLPYLLLAIPFGVLTDRISRRGLMALAEAVRALSLVAILALAGLGALTLPLLALLGFVGASGTIAFMVAAPSVVPALVPQQALSRANGRIELARTVAFVAGPALAGVLVGRTGAGPAFGLAAALSGCAVLLLAGLGEPARPPIATRGAGVLHDVREGARFTLRHPLLLPVLLTQLIFNTAWFVLQAVFVPYGVHTLGLSAAGVGTILAVYGVGLLVGALLVPQVMRVVRFGTVIAIGPVCGLVAGIVMVGTIVLPLPLLAAAGFFLLGVGPLLWIISTTTLRQTTTPPGMLGRVTALFLLATSTRSLGSAVGAVVGGLYGAEACLVLAAVMFLAQASLILASPAVRLAQQPELEARSVTPSAGSGGASR
jgi:predicted MFS family arabinose efflux permease